MVTRPLLLLALTALPALADVSARPPRIPPLPGHRRAAGLPDAVEPGQLYLAVPLDHAGRLADALPLYRERAAETETTADRLRYAGALLRAGQREEAKRVYDRLIGEGVPGPHGRPSGNLALCASSMLREGFPELAVEYLRPAERARRSDRRVALLLVRALVSAGDTGAGRAVMGRIGAALDGWESAELLELARSYVMAGDAASARRLLARDYSEALSGMIRDSLLADLSLRERDWPKTATLLAQGKRKGPPSLDEKRVNRMWRNLQRELRAMQLRLALALWKQGETAPAREQAARAALSDEEWVRSSALVLSVAGDLGEGRRDAALRRLEALAGHDHRFAPGVDRVKTEMASGREASEGIGLMEAALSGENRAADFVTRPVFEVLRSSVRQGTEQRTARSPSR